MLLTIAGISWRVFATAQRQDWQGVGLGIGAWLWMLMTGWGFILVDRAIRRVRRG